MAVSRYITKLPVKMGNLSKHLQSLAGFGLVDTFCLETPTDRLLFIMQYPIKSIAAYSVIPFYLKAPYLSVSILKLVVV